MLDLPAFAGSLPFRSPVFGLDLGEKTIGIAVSDPTLSIATPLDTIRRRKFSLDLESLFSLMDSRSASGLIVGLPVNMDGTEGPRCQSCRAFVRNMLSRRDLPVAFWDERLSTAAVTRMMIGGDLSRARRAQLVDKAAASWILQGALDRLRSLDAASGSD